MKKLFFKIFTLLLVLVASNFCLAQNALRPNENNIETTKTEKIIQDEINPFSLHPIPKSHIAFQKSIWLQVSFNQKANLPLWYAGHELSKFLIENALEGNITAYTNDKLETILSKNELLENLKIEENFENETAKFAFNSDNSIQKCVIEGNNHDTTFEQMSTYYKRIYPKLIEQLEKEAPSEKKVKKKKT